MSSDRPTAPRRPPTTDPGTTRTTRTQELADRLIAAIAVGAFSPGERLPPERELARLQDVSRVTVREALKQVTDLGLVEPRRGRDGGTFVTAGDPGAASQRTRRVLAAELDRLTDLFDYRCLIEGTVARAAATRGIEAERRTLRALLERFLATDEPAAARDLDRQLHDHVSAMTHNAHLAALCRELTVAATLGFDAEPYPTEYLARAGREHAALVDAIDAGHAEQAADLATTHFALTREILEAGLRRAGGASS